MLSPSMEESQSIARLQRGDLAGLDALIQRYQLQAMRAVYLIVRDRPTAEEIVQNAFVRLAQKINQFDARRPFGPWFLRSVVNDALMHLSTQKRQVSLDAMPDEAAPALLEYITDPHPDPEALTVTAETRRSVWEALAQLSPEQRAAIVGRYYLDLSEAEMSAEMQRPAGTVKWLLHAGRERLRHLLSPAKERECL
jgi:RNA polymerase sigma-70 factor (ECF subfamily)